MNILYENWIKLFAIVLIKRLRKWHKFCAMWYNGTEKKLCVAEKFRSQGSNFELNAIYETTAL